MVERFAVFVSRLAAPRLRQGRLHAADTLVLAATGYAIGRARPTHLPYGAIDLHGWPGLFRPSGRSVHSIFMHENDFKNHRLSIFWTYVPCPGGNNNK
ncbi:hypothetical protein P4521_03860 [Geobacillus stearothermophilus]|uniref:hypothetical protein n=1 Tax=Geobacillus stearothermophilus TaxID=1422 RepID=UPI002E1A0C4D|nr:hypothetical protein [Geobacillus stearothermophilus]